jgi:hypothetical protein
MAETKAKAKTKATATRPRHEDEPSAGASSPGPGAAAEAGHVCNVAFCPIGLALTAVQPLKPDVVEHLLVAGRELFLAAKALLEVRADDLAREGGPSTFEKIDIG